MAIISKIQLKNFKKFINFEMKPNCLINIIVGDNEAGKSTILEAISLVVNGTSKRQDNLNIRDLFNVKTISNFLESDQKYEGLPIMEIDLFFDGLEDVLFNGDNNIDKTRNACGIRMISRPNIDYEPEIKGVICKGNSIFPFEFYETKFSTFGDSNYFLNRNKPKCITIDACKMNNSYSTDDYIKSLFSKFTEEDEKKRMILLNEFNKAHDSFGEANLSFLMKSNDKKFVIKNSTLEEFENHLTILENNVCIANKGTGEQVKIKTEMALEKSAPNIDIVLIEEPENHLSNVNLKKLVSNIEKSQNEQIFIATHNGYICSRLSLKNVFIFGRTNDKPLSFDDLSEDTSKYFIKAPSVGLLDFSLSEKTILVEGPSEYMLFDKFYQSIASSTTESDKVQIIATRGLSFKRYMEIAAILRTKLAVVTDNDHDHLKCIDRYKDYIKDNIKLFTHDNDEEFTFETVLYKQNEAIIDSIISRENVLKYMLSNKTESAYLLLQNELTNFQIPQYIREAIEWIRK